MFITASCLFFAATDSKGSFSKIVLSFFIKFKKLLLATKKPPFIQP
jgi:hypothetical protein